MRTGRENAFSRNINILSKPETLEAGAVCKLEEHLPISTRVRGRGEASSLLVYGVRAWEKSVQFVRRRAGDGRYGEATGPAESRRGAEECRLGLRTRAGRSSRRHFSFLFCAVVSALEASSELSEWSRTRLFCSVLVHKAPARIGRGIKSLRIFSASCNGELNFEYSPRCKLRLDSTHSHDSTRVRAGITMK